VKISTVLNIFLTYQEFWATCACPEKQSCPENFHCIEIFFTIQDFWATCACPENRVCPESFQDRGGGLPSRLPAPYAHATGRCRTSVLKQLLSDHFCGWRVHKPLSKQLVSRKGDPKRCVPIFCSI